MIRKVQRSMRVWDSSEVDRLVQQGVFEVRVLKTSFFGPELTLQTSSHPAIQSFSHPALQPSSQPPDLPAPQHPNRAGYVWEAIETLNITVSKRSKRESKFLLHKLTCVAAGEAVALSVAIPLCAVRETLLDDPVCAGPRCCAQRERSKQ